MQPSAPLRRGLLHRVALARLVALADRDLEATDYSAAVRRLIRVIAQLRPLAVDSARELWLTEALVRLGNAYRLLGRYSDAQKLLEEALVRADAALLDPVRRAGARNALGILAKDTGDLTAAARHYAEALALLEPTYGGDSPILASLHHNLAGLAYAGGDAETAEVHIRRAIRLRATGVAADLGVATDLGVLGAILHRRGRLDEADEALTEAMARWTARYGPDHYEVAVVLHNLAASASQRGDVDLARSYLERAWKIKQRVLGEVHPEVRTLLTELKTCTA